MKIMTKRNTKGFTLAELLIVVAIIAVLVAISIPIFTNQLEKAREAVDLSNARSAYGILQNSIMQEVAPDGKALILDNAFYAYTPSGDFVHLSTTNPVNVSEICLLKSKKADLTDFLEVGFFDPEEWKDCAIIVYYDSTNTKPIMYAYPAEYLKAGGLIIF